MPRTQRPARCSDNSVAALSRSWRFVSCRPVKRMPGGRPPKGPELVEGFEGSEDAKAISNARIVSLDDGRVRFRWKKSGSRRWRTMELDAFEFLRRILQHVLPPGLQKVRHYGILSPQSAVSLDDVRALVCTWNVTTNAAARAVELAFRDRYEAPRERAHVPVLRSATEHRPGPLPPHCAFETPDSFLMDRRTLDPFDSSANRARRRGALEVCREVCREVAERRFGAVLADPELLIPALESTTREPAPDPQDLCEGAEPR
jgi:hypothetical protein